MLFDPIADMLTRIRNSNSNYASSVIIPHSILKENIVQILNDEGYIEEFKVAVNKNTNFKEIFIKLKYKNNKRVISGIKKISKPGLRVYSNADKIPKVLSGLGIAIISTSKGLMTDKNARSQKLGGEVLAYVW